MIRHFTDMTGHKVDISFPPRRIISLVPSQTELLYDLGLRDEVVGITKFCVHPHEWFRSKKRVGGTKTVHIDIVEELQPDLILANKEENVKEQVEELTALFPTWTSNIQTVEEGLQMIRQVGDLVGRSREAITLADDISHGFNSIAKSTRTIRVAYFIWRNPWMCAGGDTFISDVITRMGWVNALGHLQRYPEVVLSDLAGLNINLILLSSEPYPFKEKHIEEIKTALPHVEIKLVDGEMFSWYGSRMKKAVVYLQNLVS